jgi:hypothetical protein
MLMAKYAGETITESYWTSSLYKVFFRGYFKVTTTLGFDLRFRWKKKNRRLHFWVYRTVKRKQAREVYRPLTRSRVEKSRLERIAPFTHVITMGGRATVMIATQGRQLVRRM